MNGTAYLFDSNMWVALVFPLHPAHLVATQKLLSCTVTEPALFCRETQKSFLRLITTPAIMKAYGTPGMTNRLALEMLAQFVQLPFIRYEEEPDSIEQLWHRLADRTTASPKVWMDAYLAAFAVMGDVCLVSLDQDFKAYETYGLNWQLVVV